MADITAEDFLRDGHEHGFVRRGNGWLAPSNGREGRSCRVVCVRHSQVVCIADEFPDSIPFGPSVDEVSHPARRQDQDSETSQSRVANIPCCFF